MKSESCNKKLVAYFSASGITKSAAKHLASAIGADLFEIKPEIPYTNADLDWRNKKSRSSVETNDSAARPKIADTFSAMEEYDIVFIGFPIWWYVAPKIINTFVESYDFSGKTIMPFCTSGSTSISNSVSALKTACPNSDVKDGFRGTSSTTDTQIQNWLNRNGFSDAVTK